MLPDTENYEEDEMQEDLTEERIPDKTYFLDFNKMTIGCLIDGEEAKSQAVRKLLLTEAEVSPVYDAGYGRIFENLYEFPMTYAVVEAKDRIEEAVLQDDRFESVIFTDQQIQKRSILLSFTVVCADGDTIEMEGVEVNV